MTKQNTRNNKKKVSKWIIYLLSFFILGFIAFHYYAPHLIVEIKNPIIDFFTPKKHMAKPDVHKKGEEFSFTTFDGLSLRARFIKSNMDSVRGTIILLHGIRASKEQSTRLSTVLSNRGYQSVAMDLRAHGDSEGKYCTFGANEKKDVSGLLDHLMKEKGIRQFGIWGQSLGGAIALQALAEDKRLRFGIIESAFHSLPDVVHQYTNHFAGVNIKFLTNHVIHRSGLLADFNPQSILPVEACSQINQPVLIAHGSIDERIPIAFGRQNYNALSSDQKLFVEVQEAGHGDLRKVGGDVYLNRVFDFINTIEVGD